MDELQMQRRQQQTELFSLPLFSPSRTPCSCCCSEAVAVCCLWVFMSCAGFDFIAVSALKMVSEGQGRGSAGGDTFVIVYNLVVGM